MAVKYTFDMKAIGKDMLPGFFVGWPNPPSPCVHLQILQNSFAACVAIDDATGKAIGFINAVSDGILSAYIPLLEVLPQYQGKGIGSELVRRMFDRLDGLYMIDIAHDKGLAPFYAQFGAMGSHASIFRNYTAQSGLC